MKDIFVDYVATIMSHTVSVSPSGKMSSAAYFVTIVRCAVPLGIVAMIIVVAAGLSSSIPLLGGWIAVGAFVFVWILCDFWVGRETLFAVLDDPGHMARARSRVFRLFVGALGVLFLYILVQAARLYFML